MKKEDKKEIHLEIEQLEERIAPSQSPGQLGYEGQPGNQGNGLPAGEPRRPLSPSELLNGMNPGALPRV